jgi:hypothetical protein
MQQIVDKGDFVFIEPYYVVHRSGTICPYLEHYHVRANKYKVNKPINGIKVNGIGFIHKIRNNYIISGHYNLKTKSSAQNFTFGETGRWFIDADISSSNELTTIYRGYNRYLIKTGDAPEYIVGASEYNDKIFAIEGKYILHTQSSQLIIGDASGKITMNGVIKMTDNFIVSENHELCGRKPICTIQRGSGSGPPVSVYLLDSFIYQANGKKTKPAPREL